MCLLRIVSGIRNRLKKVIAEPTTFQFFFQSFLVFFSRNKLLKHYFAKSSSKAVKIAEFGLSFAEYRIVWVIQKQINSHSIVSLLFE